MNLSRRLEAVEHLLLPGSMLADIGCDHGYLCIDAVRSGLFPEAVAADIRPGPLKKAEEHIAACGLSGRIRCTLSDGFSSIGSEFDCAVICGMGGLLIRGILERGASRLPSVKQLVLGPHSETEELRKWIFSQSGFEIFRESAVRDAGQYYVLLDVRPACGLSKSTAAACREALFLKYGCPDIQTDIRVYKEYLSFLREKLLLAVRQIDSSGSVHSAEKKNLLLTEADEIGLILKKYVG